MKICSMCFVEKGIEDFAWRNQAKGTRQSRCRECRKRVDSETWASGKKKKTKEEARNKARKRNQRYVVGVLEAGCTDCGETNILMLEFDHVRGNKVADVSRMLNNDVSLEVLKEEIEKCEVVCANHHKVRTARRGGSWRLALGNEVLIDTR